MLGKYLETLAKKAMKCAENCNRTQPHLLDVDLIGQEKGPLSAYLLALKQGTFLYDLFSILAPYLTAIAGITFKIEWMKI